MDQHDSIENRATVVKHEPQQTPDNEMWLNDDQNYMPSPPMTHKQHGRSHDNESFNYLNNYSASIAERQTLKWQMPK